MTLRKGISVFLASLGMLLLILDSRTAMDSAAAGLRMCICSVIPALFPFLLCSSVLNDALWGCRLPLPKYLMHRLGIPEGAQCLLIPAFLGGYPSGAQAVAETYRHGLLDKAEAEHLLAFCNNAGPAFLFGITAAAFPDRKTVWLLWGIHILSAFAAGILDRPAQQGKIALPSFSVPLTKQLSVTVKTMGMICGWVVLFRIILGFLDRWVLWCIPNRYRPLIWGLLELSNGCLRLSEITEVSVRFVTCSVMLSIGGLCVIMQTASVTRGLSLKRCIRGKLIQTAFSLILSALAVRGYAMMIPAVLLWLLFFPQGRKKAVAFPGIPMYNATINPGRSEHAVP